MSLLDENVKNQLKDIFKGLEKKVKIVLFDSAIMECPYCKDTRELYEDMVAISDKLELEVYNLTERKDLIEKYNIEERVPVSIFLDEEGKDYGIRFYGIPAGYEFSTVIETINMLSTGKHHLKPNTVEFLKSLDKNVELKIFITPSCPYCPQAVFLGHQMAFVSDKVVSDMIEVSEFPQLGNKYNVMGVPRTVINEKEFQEGAAPEEYIVDKIKISLGLK